MGVALSAESPSPPSPRTEELTPTVEGSLPCCCVGGDNGEGGAQVVPPATTNGGTTNTKDGDQSYPSTSANNEGSEDGHHRASSLPLEGGVKPSCTAGDGNIPSDDDVIGFSEGDAHVGDAFDCDDHGIVVLPPPRRSSNLSQGTSLLVQALSNSKSGFGKPRLNCTSTATTASTTPSLSDVQEIESHPQQLEAQPPRNGTPQESRHQANGAASHCQLQGVVKLSNNNIGRKDNEVISSAEVGWGGDIEPHELITPVAVIVSKGPSSSQVVCVPPSFAEHQNGKQAPQRAQLQALASDDVAANPLSFNDDDVSSDEEEVVVVGLQPLTMMGVVSNTTTRTTNNATTVTRSSRRLQEALCTAVNIYHNTDDCKSSSSTTPPSPPSFSLWPPNDDNEEERINVEGGGMIATPCEGGGGDAFGESSNIVCANNNNSVLCTTASDGGGRSITHLRSQEKREEILSCDGLSSSPASGFATMRQSTRNLPHHGVLGFGHSPISLQCSLRSPAVSSDSTHHVSVVPSSGSLRLWRPPGLIGADDTEGEEHPTPLNQSHVNEWSFSYGGGGAPELAAEDDLDPLGGSSIKKGPLQQQVDNFHGLLDTSEDGSATQHDDESEPVGEYFGPFQRLKVYDCDSKVQQQRRSQQQKFGSVLFTTAQPTFHIALSPSHSSSRHQSSSQLLPHNNHQPRQAADSSHSHQQKGETTIVVVSNGSSWAQK